MKKIIVCFVTLSSISLAKDAPIAQTQRTIKLRHDVDKKKNLGYKKCLKTHYPEEFYLTVNGTRMEQGKEHEITVKNNKVNVEYYYSFYNGFRKGTDSNTIDVDPSIKNGQLYFEWEKDPRIEKREIAVQ